MRNGYIVYTLANPFLESRGCEDMKALMGKDNGDEFIDNAKYLLKKNVKKLTQGIEAETESTIEVNSPIEDEKLIMTSYPQKNSYQILISKRRRRK